MSTPHRFDPKDPQETDSFTFDWSDRLTTGDTISSVAWVIGGLNQVSTANTTTTATIVLSGGADKVDYPIRCTITTANSLTLERTAILPVRNL